MNTVTSSRRDVMRALAIVPAVIVAPAVAGAGHGLASATPGWSALLVQESRAFAAYETALKTYDEIEASFDEQRGALPDLLARPFPEVIGTEDETAEAYNLRVQAAVLEWNRRNGELKSEMREAVMRLRASTGLDDAASARFEASMVHDDAMMELLAYPSVEAAIIGTKLKLVLQRGYQDCLDEVVTSINGGRA